MEKHEDIQDAFASLGNSEQIESNTELAIEKFVCMIYNPPRKIVTVAEARLNQFVKSYKMKKDDINPIKGCDASTMPLCLPSLQQKIRRTNKIMGIQQFAH